LDTTLYKNLILCNPIRKLPVHNNPWRSGCQEVLYP